MNWRVHDVKPAIGTGVRYAALGRESQTSNHGRVTGDFTAVNEISGVVLTPGTPPAELREPRRHRVDPGARQSRQTR